MTNGRDVVDAAINMALTRDREEEKALQQKYREENILTAGVDFGGEYVVSINKIIERAVIASKREGLIDESYTEEGAVAGAAREAASQIMNKAMGLNVGGKIAIARSGPNVSVCLYFGIGILHLNEMAIGLGHRAI